MKKLIANVYDSAPRRRKDSAKRRLFGRRLLTVFGVFLALTVVSVHIGALGGQESSTGSGVIETKTFDYAGYDKIVVMGIPDFKISQSDNYGVVVTTDANIIGDVQVTLDGRRLQVLFRGDRTPTKLEVTISAPVLSRLRIGNESMGSLVGFQNKHNVGIEVREKSSLEIAGFRSAGLDLVLSGSSTINGEIASDVLKYNVNQSNLNLRGQVDCLNGVSRDASLTLDGFSLEYAEMDLREGSSAIANLDSGIFCNCQVLVQLADGSELTIDSEGTVFANVYDDSELYYTGYATVHFQSAEATVKSI
jgi:hypothetical protein